ncbi:Nif11-like leader peptide family natural product precursor [Synechococcus sp. UW179A]|uniref:Nif11-like leader peptide family natural product precursor n=1 Tax=Synechococcus sp. UW179A TaxID=2575510 RepID=UPI000E0F2616|nr:Nif11-like leader peptide family natural product precursor [Synechococcus sp. UW179A]
MPLEELKAFLKKVKGDSSLQEKLKAAAFPDAVHAISKEAWFIISADDFTNLYRSNHPELADNELEGAAGGYH